MIDLTYLRLPTGTQAMLWDMDGVLIDSLALDLRICEPLLSARAGRAVTLTPATIRKGFHLSSEDFWPFLAEAAGVSLSSEEMADLLSEYDLRRESEVYPLNPNVPEVLAAARAAGLKLAVVSNNVTPIIEGALTRSGIRDAFDAIVGNDIEGVRKKPAPDPYLYGAKVLGVAPAQCVVVEDAIPGARAGRDAGASVIAVATGAASVSEHEAAGVAHVIYTAFTAPQVALHPGAVREKRIHSPNDFVSHMIEHIAWRLGTGITLDWPNTDWQDLGRTVGAAIGALPAQARRTAALGMIDDGSAEVAVDLDAAPGVTLETVATLDRDLVLTSRCEQITSGAPLTALLEGLAAAIPARIDVRICTFEDPHHTWEGVFRALGIALSRLYPHQGEAPAPAAEPDTGSSRSYAQGEGSLVTESVSTTHAEVARLTAESETRLKVRFSNTPAVTVDVDVAPSISVDALPRLLDAIAQKAGLSLDLTFRATKLSSSHVVLEDTGIILGRALLDILVQRMETDGVNGAGSSLQTAEDFTNDSPQVGISVEGRKFFYLAPFAIDRHEMRRKLIFGHTVLGDLRSEDLDDFLDGLCVGMGCSLMVHLRRLDTPEADWQAVFSQLGVALRDCFAANPARRGLPPGVKATLA